MNTHIETESLSAYLDGETTPAERTLIEAHLAACTVCTEQAGSLRRASAALAALPVVGPTVDQARAIRQAVIAQTEKRAGGIYRRWRAVYGLAAAVALVVLGVVGYSVITPGKGARVTGVTSAAGKSIALPELVTDQQVKQVVTSRPEVTAATGRYTVSDVGKLQSSKVEAVSGESNQASKAGGGPYTRGGESSASSSSTSADSGLAGGVAPQAEAPPRPLRDCVLQTLQSQPYPMIPLLAVQVTYKGSPAYLLVYAWTNSLESTAHLDRIQVWLVDQTTCTPINFQSFKP
jgi:hypothetical protein